MDSVKKQISDSEEVGDYMKWIRSVDSSGFELYTLKFACDVKKMMDVLTVRNDKKGMYEMGRCMPSGLMVGFNLGPEVRDDFVSGLKVRENKELACTTFLSLHLLGDVVLSEALASGGLYLNTRTIEFLALQGGLWKSNWEVGMVEGDKGTHSNWGPGFELLKTPEVIKPFLLASQLEKAFECPEQNMINGLKHSSGVLKEGKLRRLSLMAELAGWEPSENFLRNNPIALEVPYVRDLLSRRAGLDAADVESSGLDLY